MSRIRTVKPSFFRHDGLQDLEAENPGAYPMFVFQGLWTQCDRNGVFEWKPRNLKLDILPFLPFEMKDTLSILEKNGYIERYEVDGKEYGIIHTFKKHQSITRMELNNSNVFPLPKEGGKKEAELPAEKADEEKTVQEPSEDSTRTVPVQYEYSTGTVPVQTQNTGVRITDNGVLKSDNGDPKKSVSDFSNPKELFLYIWQTTPGGIFNSFAPIRNTKDWARFWETSPPTCEEIINAMQNFILDVECGAIERRFIPGTPDKFVLGGGLIRHKTRYKSGAPPRASPSGNLADKKSLGGLETYG